jgi:probable HAF family extracellular repeat protein
MTFHSPDGRRTAARRVRRGAQVLGAIALSTASAALLVPAAAHAATTHAATTHAGATSSYSFRTIDDQNDPTFNQLLGINSSNVIAGYFGSGSKGHPNKGYTTSPPYTSFNNENFPNSVQTQVTAINNKGDTAGFWVNSKGSNFGFIEWNGVFTSYRDPHTPSVKGQVNQLLGINDSGIAVGFYVDSQGNSHAYTLNQKSGKFTALKVSGQSVTATGINDNGQIVGFSTKGNATTSFLLSGGKTSFLQFPGGSDTQAFGINKSDQIVGSYLDGSGTMHGFVVSKPMGPKTVWKSIDDPQGIGSTVVNGINNAGDLVGFYTDGAGNTDGFLATP